MCASRGVNARPHLLPPPLSLSERESCPFSRGLIKKTGAIIKGRHAGHRKHFTRGTLRPSPVICEIGESTLNYIARCAVSAFHSRSCQRPITATGSVQRCIIENEGTIERLGLQFFSFFFWNNA